MTTGKHVQFLYPKSRQFPFDDACEQIVRALEARGWQVPAFNVSFRDYGSGAQRLRHVDTVSSEIHDFEIRFCREQGLLPGGRWNDTAAASSVRIPRRRLNVYCDESGPRLWIYVGDDWRRDRAAFSGGIDAKLHGEPRRYLVYTGDRGYGAPRALRLVASKDPREYPPEGDEPRSFDTAEVMNGVRTYLQEVLRIIEAVPVRTEIDQPPAEVPLPFPEGHAPLFTYGTVRDARRIAQGKSCLDELPLADRYGMPAGGKCLAPTYLRGGDDLPEVAYGGFLWCARSPKIPDASFLFSWDVNQLIRVTPMNARGVYVADQAAYEKHRAAVAQKIAGRRGCFTDEEVNAFLRARACTVVPLADYKDDYEDPVYLINRELDFDEVEVIGERKP